MKITEITNTTTSYLYQRIAVDASGCQSAPSNTVTITIAPLIEPGDLGFLNVAPLNYYICEGQENPDDLVLRNATAISAGVVTYTWQSSTDQFTWSTVPSSTSNAQLTFGDSNTPTQTTYYRVEIISGSPTPTQPIRPTGERIQTSPSQFLPRQASKSAARLRHPETPQTVSSQPRRFGGTPQQARPASASDDFRDGFLNQ